MSRPITAVQYRALSKKAPSRLAVSRTATTSKSNMCPPLLRAELSALPLGEDAVIAHRGGGPSHHPAHLSGGLHGTKGQGDHQGLERVDEVGGVLVPRFGHHRGTAAGVGQLIEVGRQKLAFVL